MGPQRKQEMLADACKESPTVLEAYTNVLQNVQTFSHPHVPSSVARLEAQQAREELKAAL